MTWTPLLTGAAAERAVETAREIAAELRKVDLEEIGPSLAGGSPGLALLYTALAEATGDDSYTDDALACVESAIDMVVEGRAPLDRRLYGAPVGTGWALSVLEGRLVDEDPGDSDVDELVSRLAAAESWPGTYDLIGGPVGLAVYCLERLPRETARRSLEGVVELLRGRSEERPEGTAWRTNPRDVLPERAEKYPQGYFDIGLAHGQAGPVTVLAEAYRAGVESAGPLLRSAVDWLLAQRIEVDGRPTYPGMFGEDEEKAPTRVAWCYGDPGVAVSLVAAGEALDRTDLLDHAAELLEGCAARVAESGVVDAGLCHGSTGLGHTFNRLGQALGREDVLDLARTWFDHTIANRRPELAIAGFPAVWMGAPGGKPELKAHPGLLEGASGVGLALVSAASGTEPWWDAFLLARPASSWRS